MLYQINDKILDEYEYATDQELKEKLHAWDRVYLDAMLSYASQSTGFGMQMTAHQNRVSKLGAKFLVDLGFTKRSARNFRAAMLFHDIGKTHSSYNPSIWSLWDRPTKEEKALQKKHAKLGAQMFEIFAKEHGLKEHPHYKIRYAVTLYHHERTDSTGPEGVNAAVLPRFAQVSCLVDTFDGDMIKRPHQPKQRTPKDALRRMLSLDGESKYFTTFDIGLLRKFSDFIQRHYGFEIDWPLAPKALVLNQDLQAEEPIWNHLPH